MAPTERSLHPPGPQLAGNCHVADPGLDARVFEDGDRLKCQASGQGDWGLRWQGGDEFRADFDDDVLVVFDADAKGFTLHQGGGLFHADRMP